MRVRGLWFSTPLVGIVILSMMAASPPRDSAEPRPVDKPILKQLNAGADDLDRELFGPDERRGEKSGEKRGENSTTPGPHQVRQPLPPGRNADRSLEQQLGAAAVTEEDNPLVDIARQMREAERLTARNESGRRTQELQGQILTELDALLKKSCQQSAGAKGEPKGGKQEKGVADRKTQVDTQRNTSPVRTPKGLSPTRVAQERQTLNRKTKPDPKEVRAMVQALWGLLPEREREQMMHLAAPEEFLPEYEWMIEEYFRRLSEGESRR